MPNDLERRLRRISFIVSDVDGVLTDGRLWFDGEGRPFRAMHARDGAGLAMWRMMGGKAALVSGLGSNALDAVAKQWKCEEVHTFIKDKAKACRQIAQNQKIPLDQIAFIGDDLIDIKAMKEVGLAVAVNDAVPQVKAIAHVVTERKGGQGALRELIELILTAQNRMDQAMEKYCGTHDDLQ